MRTLTAILASSVLLIGLPFIGCNNDGTTGDTSSNFGGFGGGASQSRDCNNNQPDGFCNYLGQNPETCACADCASRAACTAKCTDDGTCNLAPEAEDCTCSDCYFKVDACPPTSVGCDGSPDGTCDLDEDCVCPDCTNTDRCTMNCLDNGSCVKYLEGCSCADCKVLEACGGNGSSSSSSAAASSSSSAAASSSAGGGGGAGGAGGGAGGAGGGAGGAGGGAGGAGGG